MVGVLPEMPGSIITHAVNIVMCYPIRILLKGGVAKILLVIRMVSVKYRLHTVVFLHTIEPCKNVLSERVDTLSGGRSHLDVKHWRQVARLQLHLTDVEVSLRFSR